MSKRILLVDDEEPVRSLVAATISSDGRYQLLEARDGREALEVACREKPDLILLDILMPGMDGFEVCRRLKASPQMRDTCIIMLTALAQEAERQQGKEAGADDYFTKPFSPTALLRKVEEVLGS